MRQPEEPDWDEFHDPEIVDWKRVRSAIEHENELTNHRLTWLLTSQAFLFAAFALVFQASTKTDVKDELRPFYQYILAGFAVTGLFACAYLSLGLLAAQRQHERLEAWWAKREQKMSRRHPPICGISPLFFLKLPYYSFPLVFVVAWIIFLLTTLKDLILPHANEIGVVLLSMAVVVGLILFGFVLGRRHSVSAPNQMLDRSGGDAP